MKRLLIKICLFGVLVGSLTNCSYFNQPRAFVVVSNESERKLLIDREAFLILVDPINVKNYMGYLKVDSKTFEMLKEHMESGKDYRAKRIIAEFHSPPTNDGE